MKADEVKVGSIYEAKVSGKIVPVLVVVRDRVGWQCENLATGRLFRARSARRFRGQIAKNLAEYTVLCAAR
jgi:hypothetical protein